MRLDRYRVIIQFDRVKPVYEYNDLYEIEGNYLTESIKVCFLTEEEKYKLNEFLSTLGKSQ